MAERRAAAAGWACRAACVGLDSQRVDVPQQRGSPLALATDVDVHGEGEKTAEFAAASGLGWSS